MKKLDLKKQYKELYNPGAKKVALVKVPRLNFIKVDGTIPPNMSVGEAPDYQNALETLYGLSYTLKFIIKLREKNPIDYPVMPLEGLWWTKGSGKDSNVSRKQPWYFTAMIMQPRPVTAALFAEARKQLRAKRPPAPALLSKARFAAFEEGLCIQIMHLGPYSAEPATIAKMSEFALENGFKVHGKHHEIYLGDPRRTAPAKLKTVLRHPVRKK
jgi:hypothetical protein